MMERINNRPWPYWGLKNEIGCSNDKEDDFFIELLQNKKIDVLSLDIEGMDLEIIKQFDFTLNKPNIVCVEWPSGTRDRDYSKIDKSEFNLELIEKMKKQNYVLVKSTISNAIFYNSEWL